MIDFVIWDVNMNGVLTFSGTGELYNNFTNDAQFTGFIENVEHIVIENSISAIGSNAFSKCPLLKTISIGATVTDIDYFAFGNNPTLTDITVNSANPIYYSDNGMLINKDTKTFVKCPPKKTGIVTVPESVEIIGKLSFSHCTGVTGILLPSSLLKIEMLAFFYSGIISITIPAKVTLQASAIDNCSNLVSIQIPNSVTSSPQMYFNCCDNLSYITVDASHPAFSSIDGVLFSKDLKTMKMCPPGRKGKYAVPVGTTTIPMIAFFHCNKLTSIVFPSTVSTIEAAAIDGCTSLISITIPASVSNFMSSIVTGSLAIEEVIFFKPVPPSDAYSLFPSSVIAQSTLRVPAASVGLYGSTDIWKDFKEIVAIEEKIALDYNEIYLLSGNVKTVNAELTGGAANPKAVAWNSRQPEVVTVSNGKLTAIHSGTTVITATIDEGEVECKVSVIEKGKMLVDRTSTTIERKKLYEK